MSHQVRRGQATPHTGDGSLCVLPRSVEDVVAEVSITPMSPALDTSSGGGGLILSVLVALHPALSWCLSTPIKLPPSQNIRPARKTLSS